MRWLTRGDEDRFWAIIEEARQLTGGTYAQAPTASVEALRQVLNSKPDPVVSEFALVLHRILIKLNKWQVWGAGFARNRGMSAEEFLSFRLWIIGKGQDAFDAIIGRPDRLVDWVKETEFIQNDGLDDVPTEIFEARGIADPRDEQNQSPHDFPRGKGFDEDKLEAQFPNCWKAKSPATVRPAEEAAPAAPHPAADTQTSDDGFWRIIDEARGGADRGPRDPSAGAQAMERVLAALEPDEVQAFVRDFDRHMIELHRWEVWGAGFALRGGLSDDGFTDFKAWIIGKGEACFRALMRDPDSLPDWVGPDGEIDNELLAYAGPQLLEGLGRAPERLAPPTEPRGREWKEEEADSLFPKCAAWAAESRA